MTFPLIQNKLKNLALGSPERRLSKLKRGIQEDLENYNLSGSDFSGEAKRGKRKSFIIPEADENTSSRKSSDSFKINPISNGQEQNLEIDYEGRYYNFTLFRFNCKHEEERQRNFC